MKPMTPGPLVPLGLVQLSRVYRLVSDYFLLYSGKNLIFKSQLRVLNRQFFGLKLTAFVVEFKCSAGDWG